MLKIAMLLAVAAIGSAATPQVSGQWTGRLNAPGATEPESIFLTLSQFGAQLSGSVTFGRPPVSAHFSVEMKDNEFTFDVRDRLGHTVTFRMKVSDAGITGEATDADAVSKVTFPQHEFVPVERKYEGRATPPVLLHKVDPQYTEEARQAHLQGTVLLRLTIDEDGKATNIRVGKGLGMGLDEKAIECVQQWRFTPAKGLDDKPTATEATIEVNFRL